MSGEDGIWVFGYGSLMWRPGFPHEKSSHGDPARRKPGAVRLFACSIAARGGMPGLVLGLDAGGWCEGMAFVCAGECHAHSTLNYLRRREQVTNVYRPSQAECALGE